MFPSVFSVQYDSAAVVVGQGPRISFSAFFGLFEGGSLLYRQPLSDTVSLSLLSIQSHQRSCIDIYLVRFVKRDNATCGIAALEEKIEANAEECAGRALADCLSAGIRSAPQLYASSAIHICRNTKLSRLGCDRLSPRSNVRLAVYSPPILSLSMILPL